jgi:thymidylate kinase
MKIAYTGSQGTGKTTAVYDLAHTLKLKNPTKKVGIFYDATRRAPAFNKTATVNSQLWLFCYRIQEEIKMCKEYDILICDRTVFDSIAYCYYFNFTKLADESLHFAKELFLKTYDEIIFRTIKHNNYLANDGIRDTKDLDYRQKIEDILLDMYKKLNIINTPQFRII